MPTLTCPKCKRAAAAANASCLWCGTSLTPQSAPKPPAPATPQIPAQRPIAPGSGAEVVKKFLDDHCPVCGKKVAKGELLYLESGFTCKECAAKKPSAPNMVINVDSVGDIANAVGNLMGQFARAEQLQRAGKFSEAIVEYDKVLAQAGQSVQAATPLSNKGLCLDSLKRYTEAIAVFEQAAKLNPRLPSAWYNMGNTYIHTKQFERALRCFEKAIDIDPGEPDAHKNREYCLQELRRTGSPPARASAPQRGGGNAFGGQIYGAMVETRPPVSDQKIEEARMAILASIRRREALHDLLRAVVLLILAVGFFAGLIWLFGNTKNPDAPATDGKNKLPVPARSSKP